MPILASFNSAANKGMMSKKYGQMGIQLSYLSRKHCWKRMNCSIRTFSPLSHNIFKSCLLLMRQNEYLWSKGLRSGVVLEQWSVGTVDCSIQEVSNTGLAVYTERYILLKIC